MTDTIISSATKEVVIGFGRPFVMIGERINPTGRKLLAAETAGHVAIAQAGLRHRHEMAQRAVAELVAPAVVDLLEVIHVHHQHRDGAQHLVVMRGMLQLYSSTTSVNLNYGGSHDDNRCNSVGSKRSVERRRN